MKFECGFIRQFKQWFAFLFFTTDLVNTVNKNSLEKNILMQHMIFNLELMRKPWKLILNWWESRESLSWTGEKAVKVNLEL